MIIREERAEDIERIRCINSEAFDTETEAKLVDTLRQSGILLISLVAEKDGELVGHILFTPVSINDSKPMPSIAGLAPMAVLPSWQKKGIGSRLVEEGIKYCRQSGYSAVVVLSYPEYYPRFGFVPSVRYGIKSEYDVPDNVFMIKELKKGALANCRGTIKYHKVFNQL